MMTHVLVPKLWFFLFGGLQKVKVRVPKELKISVIRKKKVLCNNKIRLDERQLMTHKIR